MQNGGLLFFKLSKNLKASPEKSGKCAQLTSGRQWGKWYGEFELGNQALYTLIEDRSDCDILYNTYTKFCETLLKLYGQ